MFAYGEEEKKLDCFVFLEDKLLLTKDLETGQTVMNKQAAHLLEYEIEHCINSKRNASIVILGTTDNAGLLEKYCRYIPVVILPVTSTSEFVSTIENFLESQENLGNYAVVDSGTVPDLEVAFPLHCVYYSKEDDENNRKQLLTKIRRKVKYGTGFEHDYMHIYPGDEIDDGFENVIFLDIDGVLNRDNFHEDENAERVVEEFVKNLAEIVRRTNAEIILSSSWRYGFSRLQKGNIHEAYIKMFHMISKYRIPIAGSTPLFRNGPNGRPLEIRFWLTGRPGIRNFLILDDETFWRWNWLSPHVVTTSYYVESDGERRHSKRIAGLEEKYIEEAVKVLQMIPKKEES